MRSLFAMIADTSDGVLAVDRDHRIVFCNKAAEELLHAHAPELIGKPCYEVVAGRDPAGRLHCGRSCRTMVMAQRDSIVPTRDLRAHVNDGEPVWLSVTTIVVPSRWRHLSVLIHLFRDVSRQKEIERNSEQLLSCAQRLFTLQEPNCSANELPKSLCPADLTNREREVLRLLASGNSTIATARELCISSATVKNHIQSILAKLGVHTRLEAVTLALRNGFLRDP